jgi:hypothetical protein
MKKSLLIANLVFVSFLFYSCKEQEPPKHECPPHCKDYTDVEMKGIIDANVAFDIANSYKTDKSKSTIEGTGQQDANSIWFSLETLKQYIWKMETELAKNKCNIDSLNLGIRIYYGKYPDVETMRKLGFKPEYALHHTAFIVGTYKGKKNHIDFDPWNIGKDACRPTPLRELLDRRNQIGRAAAAGAGGREGDPGVLNQGDLKPPPADEGFGFPTSDDN